MRQRTEGDADLNTQKITRKREHIKNTADMNNHNGTGETRLNRTNMEKRDLQNKTGNRGT